VAISIQKMKSVANSQRGYRESGTNHQKYSPNVPGLEWSQNQPWCATFTCWVLMKAGGDPGTDFPLTASCLQQVAWGRSRGRFHSSPKVGDLVMFGPGGGTHVELVVAVHGGTITTIGGNTSGSWGGNYWNGDGVYKKTRSASSAYGYVRPYYGASGGPAGEDDMPDNIWYTASGGQVIKPGEWTTLEFSRKTGGKDGTYWSVLFGQCYYNLTAHIKFDGKDLPEGSEVQVRLARYRKEGGLDLPGGILKMGASGASVRKVQRALQKLGYKLPKYGADSDFGSETRSALKRFQKDAGILADGEYGPKTRKAMEKEAGAARWVRFADHRIDSTVHAGGDCHAGYSRAGNLADDQRVRVRVCHYGPKPVRIKDAEVTALIW